MLRMSILYILYKEGAWLNIQQQARQPSSIHPQINFA
jgi:hypothetical protein